MNSLEFFVSGLLVGIVSTLILCALARKRARVEPAPAIAATEQLGSATTNAPDALAKIGRETGAEIIDD